MLRFWWSGGKVAGRWIHAGVWCRRIKNNNFKEELGVSTVGEVIHVVVAGQGHPSTFLEGNPSAGSTGLGVSHGNPPLEAPFVSLHAGPWGWNLPSPTCSPQLCPEWVWSPFFAFLGNLGLSCPCGNGSAPSEELGVVAFPWVAQRRRNLGVDSAAAEFLCPPWPWRSL